MTQRTLLLLASLLALAGCGGSRTMQANYGGGGAATTEAADESYGSSGGGGEVVVMSSGGSSTVRTSRRTPAASPSMPAQTYPPAPAARDIDFDSGYEREYADDAAADMAPPSRVPGVSEGRAVAPSRVVNNAPTVVQTVPGTTRVTVEVQTAPRHQVVEVAPPRPVQQPVARLTAASVGDSDRRAPYLDFIQRHPFETRQVGLDMTRRLRFRVTDQTGRGIGDAQIEIAGITGVTHADGYWDFFPGVYNQQLSGETRATVTAGQLTADAHVDIPPVGDGQDITFRLNGTVTAAAPVVDLAFVMDVTGSMGDELAYVNAEIGPIVARIQQDVPEVAVRVGAVFYRDRTDRVPLSQIPFTNNIPGFAQAMNSIFASGGGDYPEDLNAGLETAMTRLGWSQGNATRVMIVISDAPPKNYNTQFDYREAMIQAAARGIRILPVAASGADRHVEYLFRAMGTFTSTPYVYLTDDSGIGGRHQEADTDRVAVEMFSDCLVRMVTSDLRGGGMHEPGPFGPGGGM